MSGDGPPADAAEATLDGAAVAALLGLGGPGGYVVLVGPGAGRLARDRGCAERRLDGGGESGRHRWQAHAASACCAAARLPLKSASMRGVVLGGIYGSDPAWVREATRVLLPGLRVVGEGADPVRAGADVLASADGVVGGDAPAAERSLGLAPGPLDVRRLDPVLVRSSDDPPPHLQRGRQLPRLDAEVLLTSIRTSSASRTAPGRAAFASPPARSSSCISACRQQCVESSMRPDPCRLAHSRSSVTFGTTSMIGNCRLVADHDGVEHVLVRLDQVLDRLRRDVLAARGDDDVLLPVGDA